MMQQTVGLWGNNLAVRLPKSISVFTNGQKVEVSQVDEGVLIRPVVARRTMAQILSTFDGIHDGELEDFGKPEGHELW
jgi:antitoxin component of MazEF toxin-antitoxin module